MLSAGWATAQLLDAGTIVGTVQDQSGAAIPAAQVTVSNQATNVKQTTTTDAAGEYVVPSLKVGTYSLTVEKSGFQTFVRSGIIVNVQSRIAVDVTMLVGAMTQQVEVTGAQPLLETQSANVGQVVESRRIVDLPLNGRQYSSLALLVPGVFLPTGLSKSFRAGDGYFDINGNNAVQNNFILDGVDNNSFIENAQGFSSQTAQPPVDALSEFKLQTRTYDTEFGRAAGGVVNAQIKSGTNQLHGNAYEFIRNSSLDATNFFLNRAGVKKPALQQNQFGGTLGGRIVRDKAFVFGAYEGTRARRGTGLLGTVPTPLMRQFNFSEFATPPTSPTAAGLSQFSGCFNNAILDPDCVAPPMAEIFNLYPLPNTNRANEGVPGAFTGNNFITTGKLTTNANNGVFRADQKIGERDSLFEHYTIADLHQSVPGSFVTETLGFSASPGNPITGGVDNTVYDVRSQNLGLGWTHIFSPTGVLDFRVGWNRIHSTVDQLPLAPDVNAQFGINGIPQYPEITGGLPGFWISGFAEMGTSPWAPQIQTSQVWQYRGILTQIKGSHTIKTGFEWRRDANDYLDVCCAHGWFIMSGQYTGSGITDLLLGVPGLAGLTSLTFPRQYHNGWSPFAQDTWRVTRRLTLNYGIRYEYVTPFLSRENQITNFDPDLRGGLGGLATVLPGVSGASARSLQQSYHAAWAPRAGVAYRITDKLVFRGGGGVFYQNYDRKGSNGLLPLNPPFLVDAVVGYSAAEAPTILLENGFPANYLAPVDINDLDAVSKLSLRAIDKNSRPGIITQYSGGFEYSLTPDLLLSASWVGNYGHRMSRAINLNQKLLTTPGQPSSVIPFPDFRLDRTASPAVTSPTSITMMQSSGNSNYNALFLSAEKRWSKGVSFLVSYTASKSIADFTPTLEAGNGHTPGPQNVHNRRGDKGLTGVDTPQRLVASFSAAAPFGKGTNRLSSGIVGRVLEGWQINGIATVQSGQPLQFAAPFDTSGTSSPAPRADCIAKPKSISQSIDQWFDTSAFAVPAPFNFGNCSVAPGPRTPGLVNLDFSLFKEIALTEQKRLQFRVEFFNSLNHPHFGAPNSTVGTPSFGQINAVQAEPRDVQFALKFFF